MLRPALLLALATASCGRSADGASATPATDDHLFSTTRITRLELTLAPDAMAALLEKPRKPVPAALRHAGVTYRDVGVRFKGHRAMRDWSQKPALKIELDALVPGRTLHGLSSLTLNNLVEDPTMIREAIAYRLFREAGVPAPRTGYVELFVNGEPYGLYLHVETLDDLFAERRFGSRGATLYEGEYGCDLWPEDVWGFDQDAGEDRSRRDLAALADAAQRGGGDLFAQLDLPRVLAFLAVSALVADFDGYRHAHNYRLARDPASGKWTLLPWGLDRTFKKPLDPHDSDGLIARLCFADAACRADYDRTLGALARRFQALDLPREVDALVALIGDAERRDRRRPYQDEETRKQRAALRDFLAHRFTDLERSITCLDGDGEHDRDGDGYGCLDCDDANPDVHPGAAEVCGDGLDDDCSGLVDDHPSCGCPEVTIDGRELRLCNLPMTWMDAARFCEAMGMTLARIDSAAESRRLYEAAKRVRDDRWWIGLSDRAEEGEFVWHDGSKVERTRWAKHQPDNDTCNEDCVALKDGGNGRWHDTHCGQREPFVCAPPTDPGARRQQEETE